ncbi:M4 family metallopeptidase [Actinopolymorpha pittospori]|uniref:Zn-dependent metalloprotease n=1 Tax=Actinopolymorpha pittospori TaxID=648752 RepID=A0A927MV08_9ACTN|nr:M4 family metallopeptidase [Actinopolymorpha pittospori]MBE1605323.1 Zn-dependent metalloprotease [Actinopolymorpha pittospori]
MAAPANAGSTTSPAFGTSPAALVQQRGTDGSVRVLEAKGAPIARPTGVSANAKPETAAKAHLATYARAFSVPANELKVDSTAKLDNGTAVRFDRSHDGIPVFGGQLVVSLDKSNNLEFIVGEAGGQPASSFPTLNKLTEAKLSGVAKKVVAVREKLGSTAGLQVEAQGKTWYDGSLLGVPGAEGVKPVYGFKVSSASKAIQYQVMVNASTQKAELAYSLNREALNRVICDAKGQVVQDATCDGTKNAYARSEGQGPSSVEDVNKVYDFFHETAVRYASYTNLDLTSFIGADYGDGKGKALRATVRTCLPQYACPLENAFWDGTQMIFGQGVTTDDVTGHELTHGVTEHTSNLAYLFQSGAINEGLSDAMGEITDFTSGDADDTAANRWKMGEGSSLGVIRDMKDPTAYDQPDKMTSDLWFDDPTMGDNGGVHYNSGVFNKAVYLMTDGDTFNGYTIRGLGPAKAFKITWTLMNLLTPGADYKDISYTLPLSCRKNIGRSGSFITEDDCQQVDKVVRATEMFKDPVRGAAKNVGYCATGETVNAVYTQGFENKNSGWTFDANWLLASETAPDFYHYATVGKDSAVAWTVAGDDIFLTQNTGVEIPEGGFARFDNAYLLQDDDGAAVEYNDGSGWKPAADLPNVNGEDTAAAELGGGKSFAGNSFGFGGTRYDLSSLAGETVKFRFHSKVATNNSSWWVDNFKIYSCS